MWQLQISAYHVINGNNKACGCLSTASKLVGGKARVTISKEDIINKSNYKILSELNDVMAISESIKVQCECGNILSKPIFKAISQKGCKKCNIRDKNFWSQKFGRLSVTNPSELSLYSTNKIECKCDCGNKIEIFPSSLIRPDRPTRSCGNCKHFLQKWWNEKEKLQNISDFNTIKEYFDGCSITPNKLLSSPNGKFGVSSRFKYEFLCTICGSTFVPHSIYGLIRNKTGVLWMFKY